MTLYVDAIRSYQTRLQAGHLWCHLVSDISEAELHAFATRLGLKRQWAQLRPNVSVAHYDLVPSRRERAIQFGAIAVSSKELVRRNYDGLFRRFPESFPGLALLPGMPFTG